MAEKLQTAYKTVMEDHFPSKMRIVFTDEKGAEQTLFYEKASWVIDGVNKGLRYGENPGQEAAMYRLVNGNLVVGEVQTIQPGKYLVSDADLLQSGKHPGKINLTDIDNALNIIRYFGQDETVAAIMKHNNPCGIALGRSLLEAYQKAYAADIVAAFGGAIALNRPIDKGTAKAIAEQYCEVVAAPEFEEGAVEILSKRKNLRIMRIGNMAKLQEWAGERTVDFKSLVDGGQIVQLSYKPEARTLDDFRKLPLGYQEHKGKMHHVKRAPTEAELRDLRFGWLVEAGVTSNSVIYVKDLVTVGIGTGQQDRVGVAKIARDKAYDKAKDRLCWEMYGLPHNDLILEFHKAVSGEDRDKSREAELKLGTINDKVKENNAGLQGARMISDAFFPNRDGADVGLMQGIDAIVQPGGSEKDFETIEAVNEAGATMIFTGQRSFKH